MNKAIIYNPCKQHFDFRGELCPVCLSDENIKLKEKLEKARLVLIDAKTAIEAIEDESLGVHPIIGYPYKSELLAEINKSIKELEEK